MELNAVKEELLIPSLVALAVALIAGVVSLVISILSKDQKTSEFRQAWIDGLREDVSRLMAHLLVFQTASEIVNERSRTEIQQYLISQQGDFISAYTLIARVKLRLNPNEHTELLTLLDAEVHGPEFDLSTHVKSIGSAAQVILKDEWERVKRGESSFVWLKRISRLLSTIALMGALFGTGMVIGEFMSGPEPSPSIECLDCDE